ncbi:MAG: molybdenum ABC transporter ATP-binding protein [Gammaproteobacteria bacterium]|jgi:molybdate transport system ATP-binding protein|nr:MAG: molybdenum ABC transporter ATP-binding protein [Gammaproteobacteria bacterium]
MSADSLSLNLSLSLDDFDLNLAAEIALTGVTAIFGPSGSGKSSLLRTIAGFERPDSGFIRCADDTWFDAGVYVPPHRRPVGYMFQDARLFTHLDVSGNLAFAEKRAAQGPIQRPQVVEALGIGHLLDRRVAALSGGERQRVALARTLLTSPRLLLLDEPLAALDQGRKEDILPYLERLPGEFQIPALYVSHDIDEVAHLADQVLVLDQGRIKAFAPTATILERFDLAPYTGRFEAGVLVEGEVAGHDHRLKVTRIDLHGATLAVPFAPELPPGESVRLRIRARDVAVATQAPQGLSIRNQLPGTIAKLEADAEAGSVELLIDIGGPRLRARLTLAAVDDLNLSEGLSVYALVKSVGLEGSVGAH